MVCPNIYINLRSGVSSFSFFLSSFVAAQKIKKGRELSDGRSGMYPRKVMGGGGWGAGGHWQIFEPQEFFFVIKQVLV